MMLYLIFVAGSLFWFKYTRKSLKDNTSQTEMIVIHRSTQTDSDDDMSIDLSDMEIDETFFQL